MTPIDAATECIRLRRDLGWRTREIAEKLKKSESWVGEILKEYVDAARALNAERISQSMIEQQDMLDDWIGMVKRELAKGFNRQTVELGIKLCERLAKLHGTDVQRNIPIGTSTQDWIAGATDDEIRQYAKQLGFPVPEKFELGK